MTERKYDKGLNFDALRHAIEQCDLNLLLGFYAEDARLSIVNAEAQRNIPFELRGKAEIAKYLRAVYGQRASHRLEQEVLGEDRVTFREACEYPDGGRLWVATTLELHDGKIVRQADVVANNAQADVPVVFRDVVLIRGGRESTPAEADLRRGDYIRRIED